MKKYDSKRFDAGSYNSSGTSKIRIVYRTKYGHWTAIISINDIRYKLFEKMIQPINKGLLNDQEKIYLYNVIHKEGLYYKNYEPNW